VKKSDVRDAILVQLRHELARQTQAAEGSRDEAISEESRAENKWDTHSQEAAYLAQGQARLAGEIGGSIEIYTTLPLPEFSPADAIALGAIVEIEIAGKAQHASYFLGPRAGGLELVIDGRPILVLTPQSPLGRQLLGKHVGDLVTQPSGGRAPAQRIVAVQ
jgi:transcription elongation GreA/GreB family factor